MALFPTFQDANDDDPRFDTSGKKEVVDVADLPDEAPEIVAKQDAPVATEAVSYTHLTLPTSDLV